MYIDGELDGLEIAAKPEGDWALNATSIGGIIRGNASHWVTGLIDEVALWKRALSESEVSDLYSNGVPAASTLGIDLLGYWPMDEGSGDVAADATGNNNAQLYNEVEWLDDGERGSVLSFNGADAYADAGAETIPQLTQDSDFTWSLWAYDRGGSNNNVVFGNRYGPEGGDFSLVSLLSSPQGSLNTTTMVVAEATLIMMTMFQMKVGFIMLQLKQEM